MKSNSAEPLEEEKHPRTTGALYESDDDSNDDVCNDSVAISRPLLDVPEGYWVHQPSNFSTTSFVSRSRFSANLVLCFLMCVILVVEAVVYAQYHNQVLRSSVQALWHHFLPDDQQRGTAILDDIPSTLDFLKRTTLEYYHIADDLPGVFRYCISDLCDTSAALLAPQATAVYLGGQSDVPDGSVACPLTLDNPLGPFGPCDVLKQMGCQCIDHLEQKTYRIEVTFDLITTPPWVNGVEGRHARFKCFDWKLKQIYDLSHDTGLFSVTLKWDYQECTSELLQRVDHTGMFWISLLISLCALLDLTLRGPMMLSMAMHAPHHIPVLKRLVQSSPFMQTSPSMPYLTGRMAISISRWWLLWALCADLLVIISSAATFVTLSTTAAHFISHARWLILALASLMQFVMLGSFLAHDPRLYLLFNTIHTAAPLLGAFIMSSLPLFIAFALFGTVVFGKHSLMFENPHQASASLFAILNGDSIQTAFISTYDGNTTGISIISRFYIFTFTLLAIYVVANVSRVIVVEAYSHMTACLQADAQSGLGPPSGQLSIMSSPCTSRSISPSWPPEGTSATPANGEATSLPSIHVILTVLLCTLFIVEVNWNVSLHNKRIQNTESTLRRIFLPKGEVDELCSFTSYLYTMNETVDHIRNIVESYYALNVSVPFFYEHHVTADGLPVPPQLEIEYLKRGSFLDLDGLDFETNAIQCPLLPEDPVGPFNPPNLAALSDPCDFLPNIEARVMKAEVSMAFRTRSQSASQLCIEWDVSILFDFSRRAGVLPVHMQLDYISCPTTEATLLLRSPSLWISSAVLLLTIGHLCLGFFHAYRATLPRPWRKWHYITMAINLIWALENAIYRSTSKQPSEKLVDSHRLLLASACALNWVMLVAYLESRPAMRHLGSTLWCALPVAANFVVGALPVFFGYSLFGTIFLGRTSNHFGTLVQAAVTLFAVLNGDVVLDTITELDDPNSPFASLLSSFYLYTFILLMMYGMVNIFLVIMEEAYRHVVQKNAVLDCIAAQRVQ